MQISCDKAIDLGDRDMSIELSEECFELGNKSADGSMKRASYFYCSATSIMEFIILEDKETLIEKLYERCLYLFRTVNDLCLQGYSDLDKDNRDYEISKAYIDAVFYQANTNYSNILSQCGRYVKSINILEKISTSGFPMASGNLALKLVDYSYFDPSHIKIFYYNAYHLLVKVMDKDVFFIEKEFYIDIFEKYLTLINRSVDSKFLKAELSINDFLEPFENLDYKEKKYRQWISEKGLSLNQLNELYFEEVVGYDPLHLPDIILKKDDLSIEPRYHGIFNQIKQEYVSSRFLVYEGLNHRETHYSDKHVYLINTYDYPVYGIGIEKIKAAYRGVYSIFDRIAYFLNCYLDLEISEKQISFTNLWYKNVRKNEKREEVETLVKNNYALRGLWWIYKDFRNKTVYNDKHIDPILEKITKVRNAMEHKYLRILDYYEEDILDEGYTENDFAFNLSFSDFEKLTIELLKLVREAIIQLTMIVKIEEDKNRKEDTENMILGEIPLSKYYDEWKII